MEESVCYSTDAVTTTVRCNRIGCDMEIVDFISHGLLFAAWFGIGLAFCVYASVGKGLLQSVEETHSYENQATGVVAIHRKHTLFGHNIIDPRRYFIMAAMWFELPGFALVPLSLALSERSGASSHQAIDRSSFDSLQIFIWMSGMVLLVSTVGLKFIPLKAARTLNEKVVSPFLFDVGFLPVVTAATSIATCSPGIQDYVFFTDGSTCQCIDRYWSLHILSLLSFVALYIGAMFFKLSMSDNLLAVQFRFQTSFLAIITIVRGVVPVIEAISILMARHVASPTVSIIIGFLFGTLMLSLFSYNYRQQPCLGTGRVQNNLRAITFASSTFLSYAICIRAIVTTVGIDCDGISQVEMQVLGFMTIALCIAVWRFNNRRAERYNIPLLPITALLEHSNSRVQVVAAISIPLLPPGSLSENEVLSCIGTMRKTLQAPTYCEQGMLKMHTCRAITHHSNLIAGIPEPQSEGESLKTEGHWIEKKLAPRTTRIKSYLPAQDKLKRLVEREGRIKSHGETQNLITLTCEKDVHTVQGVLQEVFENFVKVLNSPYLAARIGAARSLLELKWKLSDAQNVTLLCTLSACQNDDEMAASAAVSLINYLKTHVANLESIIKKRACYEAFFESTNQVCLSSILLRSKDPNVVTQVLLSFKYGFAGVATKMTAAIPDAVVKRFEVAYDDWSCHYPISLLVEETIENIKKKCAYSKPSTIRKQKSVGRFAKTNLWGLSEAKSSTSSSSPPRKSDKRSKSIARLRNAHHALWRMASFDTEKKLDATEDIIRTTASVTEAAVPEDSSVAVFNKPPKSKGSSKARMLMHAVIPVAGNSRANITGTTIRESFLEAIQERKSERSTFDALLKRVVDEYPAPYHNLSKEGLKSLAAAMQSYTDRYESYVETVLSKEIYSYWLMLVHEVESRCFDKRK